MTLSELNLPSDVRAAIEKELAQAASRSGAITHPVPERGYGWIGVILNGELNAQMVFDGATDESLQAMAASFVYVIDQSLRAQNAAAGALKKIMH